MSNLDNRFQVIEEKFGAYSSYKLLDSSTGEYAIILPYLGGTVKNIVLNHNGRLIDILDGYTSDRDAADNLLTTFKGSFLFPFPNRIKGGQYSFKGVAYQLYITFPSENNAIHGLVFDQKFAVIETKSNKQSCSLLIRYTPSELPSGYPFSYSIDIEYRWTGKTKFSCSSKITNSSSSAIPVGMGWHPYFLGAAEKVDELWLTFPASKVLEVNEKLIPTGNSTPYSHFNHTRQINDTKLDHCFVLESGLSRAEIKLENRKIGFSYLVWLETGLNKYNYLQVYTPPSRKSIAIEPMTCIPDALNNKVGLIELVPKESTAATWGIY
jgi:aldose 1-epimerase